MYSEVIILSKADKDMLRSSAILDRDSLRDSGTINLIRVVWLFGFLVLFMDIIGTEIGQLHSSKHLETPRVKWY